MSDDSQTPMHHYPWHPGDYQLATNHWSELRTKVETEAGLLHDLAYRRLIDLYYGIGGPIPDKTQWVATRVRMLAHVDIVGSVLKEKFTREPGFWRNDKCDKEIARYRKRVVTNQENGKKGGRKPKENPPANPVGSKPRTRTKNHRNTPLPPEGVVWFEEFWTAYPRKVAKPDAMRAFGKALERGATMAQVMAGLRAHLPGWEARKAAGEGNYIPHPASWLNDDGWTNEVMPAGNGASDADKPGAWWNSAKGIMDKGVELGLPGPQETSGVPFLRYTAAVWLEAGDGPWIDERSTAYQFYVRLRNGE
jgi:uncharacterized protein YdaU (DUF1376 family)